MKELKVHLKHWERVTIFKEFAKQQILHLTFCNFETKNSFWGESIENFQYLTTISFKILNDEIKNDKGKSNIYKSIVILWKYFSRVTVRAPEW